MIKLQIKTQRLRISESGSPPKFNSSNVDFSTSSSSLGFLPISPTHSASSFFLCSAFSDPPRQIRRRSAQPIFSTLTFILGGLMGMDCNEHRNEVSSVGDSGSEAEKSRAQNCVSSSLDEETKLEDEKPCQTEVSVEPATVGGDGSLQVGFEVSETVLISEEVRGVSDVKNGCLSDDGKSVSGAKRARITVDEHQPSVHFVYNSLSRASRQKLQELLLQWSEWHSKHVSSSSNDPSEVLESGEETFFPALHVGLEKTSAVSFWMDNQTRNDTSKDFVPLDDNSVPLYDRGYALGLTSADGSSNVDGGLEIVDDAARCFNCGSYSHSLRECTRPRDNVAVSNARKQHKSRRNQNSSSRNSTRYYQNAPSGKYDGLRPGALDDETRQLLGLGELDPPPWLNRMREIGYPPGYLDVDHEDEPSGITIYSDKDIAEQEDGEIMEVDNSKPKRKKTVQFPGINAPIPENADERLWAAGNGSSSSDISRSWPQHRSSYGTDYSNRGYHREQRLSGSLRDDGPPGDPGYGSFNHSFQPRYGSQDYRSRRSPLRDEESPKPFSFHSLHYSSSERILSPFDRDIGRFGSSTPEGMYDRDHDRPYWIHSDDRQYRSWR